MAKRAPPVGDLPVRHIGGQNQPSRVGPGAQGKHAGAFNVAGDGMITAQECADLIESPIRKMPLGFYRRLAKAMWAIRRAEAPPGSIEFAIHPWIVSAEKLKGLGWNPKHSTRETFELTMRAKGKLNGAVAEGTSADREKWAVLGSNQ